jgi:two-component sensor histidine kinase
VLTSPERPVTFSITGDAGKLPSPAATSLAVVLTELLQNVVDHAYPPGALGAGESARVAIELGHGAGQLRIAVVDDGVGIAEDFDPASSSSLGLSIVGGLVAELGGTITFADAVGASDGPVPHTRRGTRVALSIPVVRAPDARRPPVSGGRSVGL